MRRIRERLRPRRPIIALEQQLLAHFAPARDALSASPLALQVMTADDASALTQRTLFPERVPASLATSSLITDTEAVRRVEGLRVSPIRGSHRGDLAEFRLVGPRGITSVDSGSKDVCVVEKRFDVVRRDVEEVWDGAVSAALKTGAATPSHHEVVFIVAFSETKHRRAVGDSLLSIVRRTAEVLHAATAAQEEERAPRASEPLPPRCVLHVAGIFIGVNLRCRRDSTSSTSALHSLLSYPQAGLYTAGAVLECISRLRPPSLPGAPARGGDAPPLRGAGAPRVTGRVLMLSDAFMHPRLLADMHGCGEPQREGGCELTVDVLPAIVSDALSTREEQAFARYGASQLLARRGQ